MASSAANGRTARPRNLKLLTGRSEGKDSAGRVIPAAPNLSRGLPVKPGGLTEDASWLWDQVLEQLKGPGLLKPLDAASLEVACQTFGKWRDATRMRIAEGMTTTGAQGGIIKAPWVTVEEQASREFRAWCAEYGLTPAAEKNLASPDDGQGNAENPFQ